MERIVQRAAQAAEGRLLVYDIQKAILVYIVVIVNVAGNYALDYREQAKPKIKDKYKRLIVNQFG